METKLICLEYRRKKRFVTFVDGLLLRKIDKIGSVARKAGSGRPRSVRTQQNISSVSELIMQPREQSQYS